MSDIDWPLALTLAAMFVVMSALRWRYFTSASRRWNRPRQESSSNPVERDASTRSADPPP